MTQKETKYAAIGHKIQETRKSKKMSQEEIVAKMQVNGCNISRGTFAKIEANIRYVKSSELECMAKIFGVSAGYLLGN